MFEIDIPKDNLMLFKLNIHKPRARTQYERHI